MISLTRLNNSTLIVNSDLIKFVEQSPDTVVTLVNGEKILARESVDEIVDRIIRFRRSIVPGPSDVSFHGNSTQQPEQKVEAHERVKR